MAYRINYLCGKNDTYRSLPYRINDQINTNFVIPQRSNLSQRCNDDKKYFYYTKSNPYYKNNFYSTKFYRKNNFYKFYNENRSLQKNNTPLNKNSRKISQKNKIFPNYNYLIFSDPRKFYSFRSRKKLKNYEQSYLLNFSNFYNKNPKIMIDNVLFKIS